MYLFSKKNKTNLLGIFVHFPGQDTSGGKGDVWLAYPTFDGLKFYLNAFFYTTIKNL